MFLEYLYLENYIGIKNGTLLNRIDLDMSKCKHKILVIRGDGGSGKSTIQRCFSMFPDPNREIIPKMSGKKGGILNDNGMRYKFEIQIPWNDKKNARDTTRCFIQKPTPDGYVELNPGGTVRSYFDILETEFGMDPNFIALSFLSTEEKGIVEKTPTERKKMVSFALDDVDIYNNLNKTYSKKSMIIKSRINNLSSRISSLGNIDLLKSTLDKLEKEIIVDSQRRDTYISNIGKVTNEINTLDPDGSIQSNKTSLIEQINVLMMEKNKARSSLNFFATHEKHGLNNESIKDIDKALEKLSNINRDIIQMKSERDALTRHLQNYLVDREEENRSIQLKTQRLMTLQSDCIYDDIEDKINKYRLIIKEYEKIFSDINIKNAISISKDEYIAGLNTLKDIKDMIDAFKSFTYPYIIEEAINSIQSNKDIMIEFNQIESSINTLTEEFSQIDEQCAYYHGLLDKLDSLKLRPSKCNIDTCPFIKEALDAESKKPLEKIKELSISMESIDKQLTAYKKRYNELQELIQAVQSLKIILRNISNNKGIIAKLPVADIFLDNTKLFNKIRNHSTFNEITEIYSSIKYANIFEEYKLAKDNLYKLEADYKIYESRNIIIEELNNDISKLEESLRGIESDIENTNNEIASYDNAIKQTQIYYDNTDRFITMIKSYNKTCSELDELQSRLEKVTSNMSKLDNALERKINLEIDLQRLNEQLEPKMSQREQVSYSIDQLEEWQKEYEDLSNKYTKLEIIKRYSSASKDGIQNRFIEAYMNDTREQANQIFRLFFGGQLELYPYDLSNGFRMPCYSYYSNMMRDDVSDCSRSEKAMAELAISIALMNQGSSRYNILRLDEVDESLCVEDKRAFFPALEQIFNLLNVQQCLMSTHSSELDLSQCDIIQLRRRNNGDDNMDEGNYIFTL